jgi:hypothetical protein
MPDTGLGFEYADQIDDVVRSDLVEAHRQAWDRLAEAGTWWTGAERIAIAAEARAAVYCSHCRECKRALSPYGLEGEHDSVSDGTLPKAAVDAVHRIVTDAGRLTKKFIAGLAADGVPMTHYVELLSVVVSIRSIDVFHRAMGLAPEPLPAPRPGGPTNERPAAAVEGAAFVPMLPVARPRGEDADLWRTPGPNVIRAMSLVPDAVRWLKELSAAQYLDEKAMTVLTRGRGPLSRAQTELVAGRVSSLNECFY